MGAKPSQRRWRQGAQDTVCDFRIRAETGRIALSARGVWRCIRQTLLTLRSFRRKATLNAVAAVLAGGRREPAGQAKPGAAQFMRRPEIPDGGSAYAMAFFRFSSTLSRKPSVVSQD